MANISKELKEELQILEQANEIERYTFDLPPYKLAYISLRDNENGRLFTERLLFYPMYYNLEQYLKEHNSSEYYSYVIIRDNVNFSDVIKKYYWFAKDDSIRLLNYSLINETNFNFHNTCIDIITCNYNIEKRENELLTLYDDLIEEDKKDVKISFVVIYNEVVIPFLVCFTLISSCLPFVFHNHLLFLIPALLLTLSIYSFVKLSQYEKS